MSPVTRMWLAFAAICTGIIHAALAATAPLPLAVLLAALALTELAWGVATFMRDRIAAPAAVLTVALAPLAVWAVLLLGAAAGGSGELLQPFPLLPMAVAGAFELFAALVVGRRVRNGARASVADSPTPVPAGRFLAALIAGALASAALVTPALAATEAGAGAMPHGHGVVPEELLDHGGH
ncbi:hypothetical protein ACFFGH_21385 [Lysobacter korlensis]|uniref:Uncharacterized protein n=1 Tax=Lysobacter korlensis TaxID=553636 RepID=A0ABV6RUW7_9GAMM